MIEGEPMKRTFLALSILLLSGSSLQAQAPFYAGKTIRIVVGYTPGGTNDLWARVIAQHMGKYIPGNPTFIVQNMPGAGSLVAANHVYGVAKPDGLTLGLIAPALYFNQLVGRKEVQFDWSKFAWIGTPERGDEMLSMRSDTGYKSLDDIRKASEPPRCGATGPGTSGHYFPKLLEEALGLKFNLVLGYPGASEVDLAIEKGEVQCRAGTISAFFGREPGQTWAKTGFVRIIVQGGSKRDERLADVPTVYELMEKQRTPEAIKRLARVLLSPADIGRPIVGSPGIPADQVKLLRTAFLKALSDAELLAEAKKRGWEARPVTGEELEAIAKEVIDQPPEVIERLKAILKG
jgi:tripartite-type tricarboxylate transporter receptor subunit TctC